VSASAVAMDCSMRPCRRRCESMDDRTRRMHRDQGLPLNRDRSRGWWVGNGSIFRDWIPDDGDLRR
jgi:hypothetical protein